MFDDEEVEDGERLRFLRFVEALLDALLDVLLRFLSLCTARFLDREERSLWAACFPVWLWLRMRDSRAEIRASYVDSDRES